MNDSSSPVPDGTAPDRNDETKREPGRNKKLVAGLAFGIGSAAIVAALLFASRHKKDD